MATVYKSKLPLLIAKENLRRAEAGEPALEIQDIIDATNISRQTLYRWNQGANKVLSSISYDIVHGLMEFFDLSDPSQLYDTIEVEINPRGMGKRGKAGEGDTSSEVLGLPALSYQ